MAVEERDLWFRAEYHGGRYPVPTDEELVEEWETYTGREATALQDVYGVYAKPLGEVAAVASIDLCEVTRQTSVSMGQLFGEDLAPGQYSTDTWFAADKVGLDLERSLILGAIQHLMGQDLVPPTDDIEAIHNFLTTWRQNGVYTVANTSTLPGCERPTIRNHLTTHLTGCFDALVLPRNHDGTGKVTKAGALSILGTEAGIDLDATPLVHIDDVTHHVQSFQRQFEGHPTSAFFMPAHDYSTPIAPEVDCQSPREAFERAHEFLQKQGVNI